MNKNLVKFKVAQKVCPSCGKNDWYIIYDYFTKKFGSSKDLMLLKTYKINDSLCHTYQSTILSSDEDNDSRLINGLSSNAYGSNTRILSNGSHYLKKIKPNLKYNVNKKKICFALECNNCYYHCYYGDNNQRFEL